MEPESDPPVACTLTAAELEARRQGLIPGLIGKALEVSDLPNGLRLRFKPEAGLLPELARVMETERECCRFLKFELKADPGAGPVTLEVTGPAGTAEMLRSL